MGWRTYGEPDPKESPMGEFLLGLYIGAFGLYSGGAWALVSLGWVSPGTMMAGCGIIGVLFGGKLAYDSVRRKRTTIEKEHYNGQERRR